MNGFEKLLILAILAILLYRFGVGDTQAQKEEKENKLWK